MHPYRTPLSEKSSVETIRERFDGDVERFASLDTGQAAVVDAPLMMELITQAAVAATQPISRVLDIGCGAGNNTIRLRQLTDRPFDATLIDLSQPMLDRAVERTLAADAVPIAVRGDFRTVPLEEGSFDVILAAAVLHHLRDDADWEDAFSRLHALLRPGGSVWISDLVRQETDAVESLLWDRYDAHLRSLGGEQTVAKVRAYIDAEDSPRPVTYQLELLRRVGFERVELLHKSSVFAAYGAIRAGS